MEIGTILRSFIGKNRDADDNTLQHTTELIEADDIQTVEQQHIPGFQYNPPVNSRGFVARLGSAWRIMLGIFDLVGRISLNPGEIILYSSSGGSVAASIRWYANGSIEINAPSDLTLLTGGDLIVRDDILCDGEVVANASSTPYSMTLHKHSGGNLGYDVLTPLPDSGSSNPKPAGAPFGTASGDIDMQGNDLLDIGGTSTDYSTHGHEQDPDSNSDTEVKTDPPS